MLEVRDLELVEAILSHGNLARAARALGLGQPVLSRRLADLEHRLGGALFLRHHARAEPTDLCRALSTDAQAILDRLRDLDRVMTETRGQQTSELRIAAGGFAAETSVLAAGARMLTQHPSVRVNIASMNWFDVLHAVREREVEFGILELSALDGDVADLAVEPLAHHPAFFVARAGHPLDRRAGLSLADILAYPLVFLGKTPSRVVAPFAAAREAARGKGPLHAAFPALVHESPTASLAVVQQSDAVAAATIPVVRLSLHAGKITILPWHEPWSTTNFGIVQPRGRRLSHAGSAFVTLLRDTDASAFAEGTTMLTAELARKAPVAAMSGAA